MAGTQVVPILRLLRDRRGRGREILPSVLGMRRRGLVARSGRAPLRRRGRNAGWGLAEWISRILLGIMRVGVRVGPRLVRGLARRGLRKDQLAAGRRGKPRWGLGEGRLLGEEWGRGSGRRRRGDRERRGHCHSCPF